MDKRENTASHVLARFRGFIQAAATLVTNIHLPNFAKGGIYQGAGKTVCVPGLNCYSCPAASGACPIGSFQSVVGSSKFNFSYYVTGTLILLGVLLGRFVCGFLCPFGWLQELLVIILSILFYRPFCKWICPLGAFYALMNRVSLLGIRVDACKCVSCGKCSKVCQMDVDVVRAPNHAECIRCGKCIEACPVDAISYRYGLDVSAEKLPLTADKK